MWSEEQYTTPPTLEVNHERENKDKAGSADECKDHHFIIKNQTSAQNLKCGA